MILALFAYPIILSMVLYFFKSKCLNAIGLLSYAVFFILACGYFMVYPCVFTKYFRVDSLNILFLVTLGIVFLAVSIYNVGLYKKSDSSIYWDTQCSCLLLFFVFAMSGAILSANLGLFWVFVEATSIVSAPLIYMDKTKSSLEAAWKYIFICSIGISLAFVGIIFISMSAVEVKSLFFDELYKHSSVLVPFWLKLSLPFIFVGFGTKAGLAPVHAWLPDAHSEAPAHISAMLSGALLNSALLGILRVYKIVNNSPIQKYGDMLLILMGVLSLLVSAVYILRVNNYKRMLAYSSVENIGIIALGVGIGGVGVFAAMFHLLSHSLIKTCFFLTSGNIYSRLKTKYISSVSGLIKIDKINGWLWVLCCVAILGFPPFPLFISKFYLLKGIIESNNFIILIPVVLFLVVILFGMASAVFKMSFGKPLPDSVITDDPIDFLSVMPQIILFIVLVILGLYMPSCIYNLINNAALNFK